MFGDAAQDVTHFLEQFVRHEMYVLYEHPAVLMLGTLQCGQDRHVVTATHRHRFDVNATDLNSKTH